MFKPDPRPSPEDVGCTVYKPCEDKCLACVQCIQFSLILKRLAPHDVQSKFQRTTWEWRDL